MSTWLGWLYFGGAYEPATSQLVRGHLKAGFVFIEVGANLGYFSMLAAERVGPEGRVLAFEPNPEQFGMLTSTLSRNRFANVQLFEMALGDHDREVELFLSNDPANDGLSPITPFTGHIESGALSGEHTICVAERRFDSVSIDPQLDRIDLINTSAWTLPAGRVRRRRMCFSRRRVFIRDRSDSSSSIR